MILALSPTFAVSCMDRGAGDPLSVKYVQDIVADTASLQYTRVKMAGMDGAGGSLTVFGPSSESFFMAEKLLNSDDFDNVDGRALPDGLPDFAGETVAVISDLANEPYSGYILNSNEDFLREAAVRSIIDALDTAVLVSQYDRSLSERKTGAKIVVLSSSYLSAYGYYDIASLLRAARQHIKVISPAHAMFDYAVRRHGDAPELAVWTSHEIDSAGIYPIVTSQLSSDYPEMKCEVLCPSGDGDLQDRIISFLRMYKASGNAGELDAAIVDDIPLRASELNSALEGMWDNVEDSLIVYRSLLAGDFEFIDAGTAVVSACIREMRAANLFTHRILYPQAEFYMTVPLPGIGTYGEEGFFTDPYRTNRAPSSGMDTFVLVRMKKRSMPKAVAERLEVLTPAILENYVSD